MWQALASRSRESVVAGRAAAAPNPRHFPPTARTMVRCTVRGACVNIAPCSATAIRSRHAEARWAVVQDPIYCARPILPRLQVRQYAKRSTLCDARATPATARTTLRACATPSTARTTLRACATLCTARTTFQACPPARATPACATPSTARTAPSSAPATFQARATLPRGIPLIPLNPAESRFGFNVCPRRDGGTGPRAWRDMRVSDLRAVGA